MRPVFFLLCLACGPSLAAAPAAPTSSAATIRLSSGPSEPWIERLPDRQDINFEIFIDNGTGLALEIAAVELSAYDAQDRLLLQRLIDGNGIRPSVQTVPQRALAAGERLTLFNPFPSLAASLPLARLHYLIRLESADGKQEFAGELDVHPRARASRTALRLPLRGRLINYDGHDFLAHHRRFDYTFAPIAQLGFKSNFMRYAYDFVPVNADGAMHRGSGSANDDYFGFGAELLADGDGVVVAVVEDRADDRHFDQSEIASNPMALFGNYLVIDHGNGEFSVYGHLKQGSVRPVLGQHLRQGELVAQIGASGSALFPHLHYELQDGPDTRAEGLPSYFSDIRVWLGGVSRMRKLGTVDTGEIVEAQ